MAENELSFDLYGRKHKFGSFSEIRRFLEKEREEWSWLARVNQPGPQTTWNRISQQFASNIQNTHTWESQNTPLSVGKGSLDSLLQPNFIYSDSPAGRSVEEIRKVMGEQAGAFAYSFSVGDSSLGNVTSPLLFRAAMAISVPQGVEFDGLAERMTEEREAFRNAAVDLSEQITGERELRNRTWSNDRKNYRDLAKKMLAKRIGHWKASQAQQASEIEGAIASIRSVETAYTEMMGLKAPVEYWEGEASKHRTSVGTLFMSLIAFFALSVVVLGAAFFLAGRIILSTEPIPGHPAAPVALYVVISGALASLSTLIFWIGRLLTKMYLSTNHLRQDAEERAVMTKTYLALTHEAAATDDERKLVLAALFRNTSDGIVKDEGPGDLAGIAALLSSLATKH